MSTEDRAPRDGVAGVRLAGVRLAFVRGVPRDVPVGASVRVRLAEGEQAGTMHIPPALLFWCDPAAALGDFLGLDPDAPAPDVAEAEAGLMAPAVEWLLAPEGAPDDGRRAAMLDLARADLLRLDDPKSEQARSRPGSIS